MVNPAMMRLTWMVIEETPASKLLTLPDTVLVKMLLQQVASKILLTGEEVGALYDYICSRLGLIRDMAEARRTK